jgi:Type II secretion system (T2SS), protein M subtype b
MTTTRLAGLAPSIRPQDRRALLLGGIALAFMLGWTRVVRPGVAQLRERERAVATQRDLLARERALLVVAPKLSGLQRATDRTIAAESPRLFAGDSVGATAELTAYVADVASESDVRLTSVEARAPSTERGVLRLLVDARGEGSWSDVLGFVKALESSEQLADVESVRIERGPRGNPAGGAAVTVTVTVAGYGRGAR